MDGERLATRTYVFALLAILGLALALRLTAFSHIPPGLYHDEAYNGLDALQVLRGWHPLWFPANNGREPLFIYLVAASISVLGQTAAAIRAPSLILGLLTVPATAFLGCSLFDRWTGLLASAVVAVAFWPVHLSRIGFRAVGLPLFLALAVGFLWRGLKSGRWWEYLVGGICYGVSFYTYLAARFTPLPLVLLGALLLWPAARLPRPEWRKLALFVATAILISVPLLGYMVQHPEVVGERVDQVSIFAPTISHGDPWSTLVRHTLRTLGAFFIRGDRIPRHNLPGRPIFDPGLALAFLVGVGVSLKRRGAGWFTLLWVITMSLPTVLAEDAPHFLRGVGIQPFVFILPALGLAELCRWSASHRQATLGIGLTSAILLGGLVSTAHDYFQSYAHDPTVYYYFEAGSRELANRVGAFLDQVPPGIRRRVYISERLWRDWPSLRFLLSGKEGLQVVAPGAPVARSDATEVLLITWPYEPYDQALAALPPGSTIEVVDDLYEQGDLEREPRKLALIFQARPNAGVSQPLAVFEHGVRLLEVDAQRFGAQQLRVRLVWEVGERLSTGYTVFVHVMRGQTMLGQHDGPPANSYLPTVLWQPGDRIVDRHEIALSAPYDPQLDRIVVGLYDLTSMTRLHVVESRSPATHDAIPVAGP